MKALDSRLFGLKSAHYITATKAIVLFLFHLPLIVLGISLAKHPLSWCHEIIPGLQQWLLAWYPQRRKHHPPLGWHRKIIENPVFHFRNPNITLLAYNRSRYLVSNIDNNLEGGPTNVLFIFNQSSLEQHNIWKKFIKYRLVLFHVNFSSSTERNVRKHVDWWINYLKSTYKSPAPQKFLLWKIKAHFSPLKQWYKITRLYITQKLI